jgi:hypothetical protein
MCYIVGRKDIATNGYFFRCNISYYSITYYS